MACKQLDFDSVELSIGSVSVNGKDAQFSTDARKLHVDLEHPGQVRRKYVVTIRYEGKPKKGLYFILPNKSNPTRPNEIWTQGEAEDTRYYLPIYDYPNNRDDHRHDSDRSRELGDGVQREAGERGQRGAGNEDLDVAPVPAGLDVPDLGGRRRIR